MPAFNFHRRFASLVQSGKKRMTIRADRADGRTWSVGTPIALYTGMRSRACTLLGRSTLTRSEPVLIAPGRVRIGRNELSGFELEALAKADGIEDVSDFMAWFLDPSRRGDFSSFTGQLYGWGDLLP